MKTIPTITSYGQFYTCGAIPYDQWITMHAAFTMAVIGVLSAIVVAGPISWPSQIQCTTLSMSQAAVRSHQTAISRKCYQEWNYISLSGMTTTLSQTWIGQTWGT
jgi:hypothetical protein